MPKKTMEPRKKAEIETTVENESLDEGLKELIKEYVSELTASLDEEEPDITFVAMDENAEMPRRATEDSAGYDFFSKEMDILRPGEVKRFDTGIKAKFPEDLVLLLFNRSSNPSKGLVLMNGVGVVDAGYYNAKTNIMFELKNITKKPITITVGDKLGQGVFTKHYVTKDDDASGKRSGGFGSTGK